MLRFSLGDKDEQDQERVYCIKLNDVIFRNAQIDISHPFRVFLCVVSFTEKITSTTTWIVASWM